MTDLEFCIVRRQAEQPVFIRVFKALPPKRLDYRPEPRARSAAEIAWLLVAEEAALIGLLDTGTIEWKAVTPPVDVGEMALAYEENATAVTERLRRLDEAGWQKKGRI